MVPADRPLVLKQGQAPTITTMVTETASPGSVVQPVQPLPGALAMTIVATKAVVAAVVVVAVVVAQHPGVNEATVAVTTKRAITMEVRTTTTAHPPPAPLPGTKPIMVVLKLAMAAILAILATVVRPQEWDRLLAYRQTLLGHPLDFLVT